MSLRQKVEEIENLKNLLNKRDDFAMQNKIQAENRTLRTQMNKMRLQDQQMQKMIINYKMKRFIKKRKN